jgi:hypothetical protein
VPELDAEKQKTVKLKSNIVVTEKQNAGRLLLDPPGVSDFLLRASNLLSPVDVPLVPLPSATPFGQAIWHFEQPIVLADRGTPRQQQSRRLASVGSRPLGPRNETLRNVN